MDVKRGESNPYYDKWGKGRPSNWAKERRRLSHEWNKKYRELFPAESPFLNHLLECSDTSFMEREGKIYIEYKSRTIELK